ncbi:MAG: hypothetical protein CSA20_05500 [Deltaproteobacteria bacterium]|nr:MAG: hypothetical protein CSA20_05500 [Deltaproteobacteria bacterium]
MKNMLNILVGRSLTVRKNRVAISVFSITIGAVIVTALSLLYFDISQKMHKELRTYGANFILAPASDSNKRDIDSSVLDKAMAMIPADAIYASSPYLYGVVHLDKGNAIMAGVDFSGLRQLSSYWQVEGGWISVDFDDQNCMVGKTLAATMELKIGSRINVVNEANRERRSVRVKGIVETGQDADNQIIVSMALARELLGGGDTVSNAMLSLYADKINVDQLGSRIEKQLPEIDARPIRKISQSEGKVVDKIKGLIATVIFLILATTTLCVMTTMMAVVTERTKEIGLLMALGAKGATIQRLFQMEALIMSAFGVAFGLVFGFFLAQFLGEMVFHSSISFRWVVIPITITVSLLSALIASVLPVRQAVRIDPAQVLRGGE